MDSGVRLNLKIKLAMKREKNIDETVSSAVEQTLGAESGKIESVEKKSRILEGDNQSKTKRKGDKKIEDETLVAVNGNLEEMKKKKRPIFSISLTKDEIEADLKAMGVSKARPSKRMKKRSKSMQKILDNLFPGLRLKSINPNDYGI